MKTKKRKIKKFSRAKRKKQMLKLVKQARPDKPSDAALKAEGVRPVRGAPYDMIIYSFDDFDESHVPWDEPYWNKVVEYPFRAGIPTYFTYRSYDEGHTWKEIGSHYHFFGRDGNGGVRSAREQLEKEEPHRLISVMEPIVEMKVTI